MGVPRAPPGTTFCPFSPGFPGVPPGSSTWLRLWNGPVEPLPGRVQHIPLYPQPPLHCPPHASGKLNHAGAIQLAARGRMEPDLHKIYPKNATQAFQ